MAKIGNKSNAPYKLLPRSTPCEVHFSGGMPNRFILSSYTVVRCNLAESYSS